MADISGAHRKDKYSLPPYYRFRNHFENARLYDMYKRDPGEYTIFTCEKGGEFYSLMERVRDLVKILRERSRRNEGEITRYRITGCPFRNIDEIEEEYKYASRDIS